MGKSGAGNPGAGVDGDVEDNNGDEDGEGGIKLGNMVGADSVKPVNGGLENYNKMDIKFAIQRKIPEWAMACADEISQEKVNRDRLRQEAINLAVKLFYKNDLKSASGARREKMIE